MKKLLALLLLIPFVGNGQIYQMETDTIPVGSMDTVKVRLLILDTCYQDNNKFMATPFVVNAYRVSIRQKYIDEPGSFCTNCTNYWVFVMFLDNKKRPLSKCIEIWKYNQYSHGVINFY